MTAKGDGKAKAKRRKIAVDDETAALLAARADALGISVAELIAMIAGTKPAAAPAAPDHTQIATNGAAAGASGAPPDEAAPPAEAAPPDARWREVKAWIDSWGKSDELPRPKLGK
jgi:hypothetical protein